MEILDYLLHHKNFNRIFLFNFFLYIIYWFVLKTSQEMYIELSTELLVFLVSFPFFFFWQSIFQRAYESSFIKFRMMGKCHIKIEKQYCLINLSMAALYGFVIGVMLFLISGSYISSQLFGMAFMNIMFIIMVYVFLSSVFSRIYLVLGRINIALLVTLVTATIFSLWLFLNRVLVDLYSGFNYYCMIIILLIALTTLMVCVSSDLQMIRDFHIHGVLLYIVLVLVYFFQSRLMYDNSFTDFITMNLRLIEINEIHSFVRYLTWNISKVVILASTASLFTKYLNTTYQYFKIREHPNVWLKMILKEIARVFIVSAFLQLLVGYFARGIYPTSWEDIILLIASYTFLFILACVYMLIYLLYRNPAVIMYLISAYFVAGLICILLKNEFLINLLLQQTGNMIYMLLLFVSCGVLLYIDMHLLKTMKE